MKIACLVQRDVTSCTTDDNLDRVAQLMWDRDVGCLPVLDRERVVAMVTDRDVCMAAYTQGKPLREIPVRTAMSKHVFACTADDDVGAVERLMWCHKVRRVPVVDREGRMIGIVSLNDLARNAHAGKLPLEGVVATLAEVGLPPWSMAPGR